MALWIACCEVAVAAICASVAAWAVVINLSALQRCDYRAWCVHINLMD
jgi:hypothetical protein